MKKFVVLILIGFAFVTGVGFERINNLENAKVLAEPDYSYIPDQVLPQSGYELPISWGDIGPKLVESGTIDSDKFMKLLPLDDPQKKILLEGRSEKITINAQNSQFVVDMLWALGLSQKSLAYTEGPMGQEYKKDIGNFSSTAGWSLAKGNAVTHLGKHDFVGLSDDEQKRVAEISKNIYRPCCGNSTWFPDCNHGMAALAAVELMVKAGMSDDEIYKNVLKLNSFWFPQTYLVTAYYFAKQGVEWKNVNSKEVLGSAFSSSQGAVDIARKAGDLPFETSTGGSCGA